MTAPRRTALLVASAASLAIFWRTAYPTITWWDSSSYSLGAATMGVDSAPGSLLLTLLGWPIAQLAPAGSVAYALNLFTGVLATISAALVAVIALRMVRLAGGPEGDGHAAPGAPIAAVLGALTLAFSTTLWEHATKFTPYILTAVFTGLILLAMLRWWEEADRPDSWRHIALLGILFGLDFSVHRTNALLMPAALAWILVRHPGTLRRVRTWAAGAGGLAAGLAVHLLVIPIARLTTSTLNFTPPTDLGRFWDYVSLKMRGGGFLVEFFPRKAGLWSVQVADLLRTLRENFLHWDGPIGALGILPALAALFGLVMLWRRNRRMGLAFTLVLLLHATMTVMYFNIPADFFRSLDRHYLPICVVIAALAAYGLATAMRAAAGRRFATAGVAAAALLLPGAQLARNWNLQDASRRYFTHDYAVNALQALPPDAIYFTVGDNDTYPVLYVQGVEGVRRDVTIVNLSLANMDEYLDHLLQLDPSFPLSMAREQRWAALRKAPKKTMLSDVVQSDIVRTNAGRRPLTYAITATKDGMGPLKAYGRLDGLFYRVAPAADPAPDLPLLRANLARNAYRGYADPTVRMDEVTRGMGYSYHYVHAALADAELAHGSRDRCRVDEAAFFAAVPLDRLGVTGEPAAIARRCR